MLSTLAYAGDARVSFKPGVKCNGQCLWCCCSAAKGGVGRIVHVGEYDEPKTNYQVYFVPDI